MGYCLMANIDDAGCLETVTTANWVFSLILRSDCIVGITVISRFLVVGFNPSPVASKIDDICLPHVASTTVWNPERRDGIINSLAN
jgi:hypothetical protein